MDKQITAVGFDADSKLTDYVNERLEKLPKYHDKITKTEVFLKLENVGHQIKDKVAEIKVDVPGYTFFVKEDSKSFEKSFKLAFDSLLTQMRRRKSK